MHRRPFRTVTLALGLGMAVAVAGCSSDDKESAQDAYCEQLDKISAEVEELTSKPAAEQSVESVKESLDEIEADLAEAREQRDDALTDRWNQLKDAAADFKDQVTEAANDTPLSEMGTEIEGALDDLESSWSATLAEADCDSTTTTAA